MTVETSPDRDEWPTFTPIDHVSADRARHHLLGGPATFPVDQDLADAIEHHMPDARHVFRVAARFAGRAVGMLLENGIRQFLYLQPGLTADIVDLPGILANAGVGTRLVWVESDRLAAAHWELVLKRWPHSSVRAAVAHAELPTPEIIFGHPVVGQGLDMSAPVGLLIFDAHTVTDTRLDEWLRRCLDQLPEGSYLAFAHMATDVRADQVDGVTRLLNARDTLERWYPHDSTRITAVLADLVDLVPPGLTGAGEWRPIGPGDIATDPETNRQIYVGVGRKISRSHDSPDGPPATTAAAPPGTCSSEESGACECPGQDRVGKGAQR